MTKQEIEKRADDVAQLAARLSQQRGLTIGVSESTRCSVLESAARVYSAILFRDTIETLIETVKEDC